MLTIPDLNRVKVFYVVYKSTSLIKAAHVLNITRSAVSQSLKALEEELQTKLFIRDSKKILPTEPAELLFRAIEPFMTELQATIAQIETGKNSPAGHLRIHHPRQRPGGLRRVDQEVRFLVRPERNRRHGRRARSAVLFLQPRRMGPPSALRPLPRVGGKPARGNDMDDRRRNHRGHRRS